MSKSHEIDQLIDDLYPIPSQRRIESPAAPRIATEEPQFSIAKGRRFGEATLRGYDLVVSSYNDPDGAFHKLGVMSQAIMIGRYGLAGESIGTPLTTKETAKRVGMPQSKVQWRITKALVEIARKR